MVKYPVSKLNQKCISIVEDKLWTFRLFRASIHVGIQKLTFHACLFMHLAWQIIQLPDLVITLEFLEFCNSRAFSLFYCENATKISFSGCFQHDESPDIKSVLVIALELILDLFQNLNLKKCGYFCGLVIPSWLTVEQFDSNWIFISSELASEIMKSGFSKTLIQDFWNFSLFIFWKQFFEWNVEVRLW